jgi:PfaB family protein
MLKFDPIAIVGAAGIFPAAADIQSFWRLIHERRCAIVDIPADRWGLDPMTLRSPEPAPDRVVCTRAGLITSLPPMPTDLHLPVRLGLNLDPLYHLALAAGASAVAQTELLPATRRRTGVILAAIALPTEAACGLTRYLFKRALAAKFPTPEELPAEQGPLSPSRLAAARVTALPAILLARALHLEGGAFTLDAACASSLYAVKLACDELHSRRADAMLAGGVSRPDNLYTHMGFTQLRALSASGRCAPFDASADGLVVGEGAGVLVLKRLDDALRNGDQVRAVIRGIGLSNDMRGNLLAPDTEGQLRAMRAAYQQAGWPVTAVDHIECHGAGTRRGDAVELESLSRLWQTMDWKPGQCAIGSVKSNIGHLLTAAGAAGLIKTLLALEHATLAPSLHFQRPAPGSPLAHGPFRVQTHPLPWLPRSPHAPRRAAVSAFGFGGINAHLLLEEVPGHYLAPATSVSDTPRDSIRLDSSGTDQLPEVAIVGMAACVGPWTTLEALESAIFAGLSGLRPRPPGRWKNLDSALGAGAAESVGAYLREVEVPLGRLAIPPREILDILPQHLLMLVAAGDALTDAGQPLKTERPRASVLVGMGFDFEATDFHLRWCLDEVLRRWDRRYRLGLEESEILRWVDDMRNGLGPPLTPERTLGALGGLIASRVAREFRFGGPSYTVSAESLSGLQALEIGLRALQAGESDLVVAGAVDLAGDLRQMAIDDARRGLNRGPEDMPIDPPARFNPPGDGACAVVLKRLDDALQDGDRIYALVRGCGRAVAADASLPAFEGTATLEALKKCLTQAHVPPASVGYLERQSDHPSSHRAEAWAINALFSQDTPPLALGTIQPILGHTGAAAGLFSLLKAVLCLHRRLLPPLPGASTTAAAEAFPSRCHLPRETQYWYRDRAEGPRRACVTALTPEGLAGAVLLEEAPAAGDAALPLPAIRPGPRDPAVFVVWGSDTRHLGDALADLGRHLEGCRSTGAPLREAARRWRDRGATAVDGAPRAVLVAADYSPIGAWLREAHSAMAAGHPCRMEPTGGVHFNPRPLGRGRRLALVYPGSGNHFLGMGQQLGAAWPSVMEHLDRETEHLRSQTCPELLAPYRQQWSTGWERDAHALLQAQPLAGICATVVFGAITTALIKAAGLRPGGVIGYSLGEATGYFATGAWPDRGQMLERLNASPLFREDLCGRYASLRQAWGLPAEASLSWQAAVVNRPAIAVREALAKHPHVRLLAVNSPDETLIGGLAPALAAVVAALGCEAVILQGVLPLHCDAALPCIDAYRALHTFPTAPSPELVYYSVAHGRILDLTSASAAASIAAQALEGFDFNRTIRQAHADGFSIFIEMGPMGSCTRMIRRILADSPHLALSLSQPGEDEVLTVAKVLGTLVAEGVSVDPGVLFGSQPGKVTKPMGDLSTASAEVIRVPVGRPFTLVAPNPAHPRPASVAQLQHQTATAGPPTNQALPLPPAPATAGTPPPLSTSWLAFHRTQIAHLEQRTRETAATHRQFLEFSNQLTEAYRQAFEFQTRLLKSTDPGGSVTPALIEPPPHLPPPPKGVAYDRSLCLEFAVGSAAKVLGAEFASVDAYPVRVRLPDEPLMLVDRILEVEGRKGSLTSGRIVTEHDVRPASWYLDGGRAPVCIAVEAGQADLFLSAYLGIDLAVQGTRAYRLLDATVTFHRGLPRPGDTIRYEIAIEKFIRQGPTWMFFFHFTGTIGAQTLITMRDGCAGFFTPEEVKRSGGILLTEDERRPEAGQFPEDWTPPVPIETAAYDDRALDALRRGDAAACFGPLFHGITIPANLRLPGGRMRLIHRVLELDPRGGRHGIGSIRAEADIRPDDWFLTCHFVDDMVMPGTLMYECCAHTLRVLLMRMGWITDSREACWEPLEESPAMLKCRGPVTPTTRRVAYQVDLKTIGFHPEPFAIADAHMFADDRRIVLFRGLSLKLTGVTREAIEAFWANRLATPPPKARPSMPVFQRRHVLAFATGRPSEAFGAPYRPFDQGRFIARLPAPPYAFIDRVTSVEPAPWVLAPGGWLTAEYDVPPQAWYFRANRSPIMPLAILMEVALQACGFLAAYLGSALQSDKALHFRNLDGEAQVHRNVAPADGTLTTRVRLLKAARAADILIEHFEFDVRCQGAPIYSGTTSFGFFTPQALANQVGIRPAPAPLAAAEQVDHRWEPLDLESHPPMDPEDDSPGSGDACDTPGQALRMIDRIEAYQPGGGDQGRDYVRGIKRIAPAEWFFKAHFFQDPVWPGSLGIEALMQLIRFVARQRGPAHRPHQHLELLTGHPHRWQYRGQVLPINRQAVVEALVAETAEDARTILRADGYLQTDKLYIYKMHDFGLQVPIS